MNEEDTEQDEKNFSLFFSNDVNEDEESEYQNGKLDRSFYTNDNNYGDSNNDNDNDNNETVLNQTNFPTKKKINNNYTELLKDFEDFKTQVNSKVKKLEIENFELKRGLNNKDDINLKHYDDLRKKYIRNVYMIYVINNEYKKLKNRLQRKKKTLKDFFLFDGITTTY